MKAHPREPVEHTCPDIDRIIKRIRTVQNIIKDSKRTYNEEELSAAINDIDWEIYGMEDELEKLRGDNSQLRAWAIDEAENVDSLENEANGLYEKVERMQKQLNHNHQDDTLLEKSLPELVKVKNEMFEALDNLKTNP